MEQMVGVFHRFLGSIIKNYDSSNVYIMFVYGYSQYLWPLIMTTAEEYWTVVMGMKIIYTKAMKELLCQEQQKDLHISFCQ